MSVNGPQDSTCTYEDTDSAGLREGFEAPDRIPLFRLRIINKVIPAYFCLTLSSLASPEGVRNFNHDD